MSEAPLYMVRAELDVAALVRRGRRQGLPLRDLDLGYLVHSAVDATFGGGALRPFSASAVEHSRCARVLAYSTRDGNALRDHAQAFAEPSDHAAWDWEGLAVKRMPSRFEAGRRVGFRVRACPTRRSQGSDTHRRGAERDAFLIACSQAGDGATLDREAVYRGWLGEHLERGGASVERTQVEEFSLRRMLRRTQGGQRVSRMVKRPDVVFSGVLAVQDPDRFSALLRRGIGRHRAFGFGMLLLVPA